MARREPIGMHGRAARRCGASRARPSSSRATTRPRHAKSAPPRGKLLSVLQQYQASEDFTGLADQHAAQLRRARSCASRRHLPTSRWRRSPTGARAASSRHGATASPPTRVAGKPTMRGRCSRASCRGASTEGWLQQIPASAVAGSIAARVLRRFGPPPTRQPSSPRAPAHLHLPLLLALWTGQRQGDLLRLPWSAYDGNAHPPAAIEDGQARVVIRLARRSRLRSMLRRSVRRSSYQQRWQAVDIRRLPRVMGQGVQGDWRPRCDVSRPTRHGSHPARRGRSDRSGDREHYRALVARRARDTRYALPRARSCARRERVSESSKEEQNLPTDLPTGLGCSMGRTGKA